MNILILFATYSGSTEAVAEILKKNLEAKGHSLTLTNPKQAKMEDIRSSDLTIVCSPSWDVNGLDGQPHEDFFPFMENAKNNSFEGKQFAFVGLGDSSYPHFCGAILVLETFIKEKMGVLKTQPLKIDGFFYDEAKHTKIIEEWVNTIV